MPKTLIVIIIIIIIITLIIVPYLQMLINLFDLTVIEEAEEDAI